ncbi:tRNA preQ1(34) S-adenosylmethionine ribosyltransferase-isomerase QueA [bacterium]|nr:MAG: tRNA preQ1(34) S-adenosylmethionine ribosyltransferase-isomerase QueA [bacterium]RIK65674.1 MAG: tRNA preQ1(34) S-adenosylmethionine ribosyltransferase-isomerase QueA [Planctomycetota bacterium]
MRSDTFNFTIPPELIAQQPAQQRDESRLMVLRRDLGVIEHHMFRELPSLLRTGDVIVANNTRVRPCRLFATRDHTGGSVELFLLRPLAPAEYEALTGSKGRLEVGESLRLPEIGKVELLERDFGAPGHWRVRFDAPAADIESLIEHHASMPLPPYIRREKRGNLHASQDRERYQTVFAARDGAVAAPTAGLHFTPAVFRALESAGVRRSFLTLHVGPGTFRPLKADTLAGHEMHAEEYEVNAQAAADIAAARTRGGRVVAVGTTACRTLETMANERGQVVPGAGRTRLFIYPPWRFRCVDALLTNFHLPRSTLIFLVAALAGVEFTRRAYLEAIDRRYRFFSYGDAMLVV